MEWSGIRGLGCAFDGYYGLGNFLNIYIYIYSACVYNFIFKLCSVGSPTPFKFSFYCAPFELVRMELNPWAC